MKSLSGTSSSLFAIERFNLLIQVLAVGKSEELSTKDIVGEIPKPSTGSSSVPQINFNILPRSIPFLLPPKLK